MPRRTVGASGRWGRVAAVGIGALLATASVVPATAAQADATTTVRGTVQSGATRLAGVRVGFWSRTGHRIAATTTGATGAFTLHVPSGVRGFAYAGAAPDAARAVFSVHGHSYVRGVIGATQGETYSFRLYQAHLSATAAGLAGGGTLRFRLQRPGRIAVVGGAAFAGSGDAAGLVQVLRLNGSVVEEDSAQGADGVLTSALLVPGTYRLHYFPRSPYLRRTVDVTVAAGGTTRPTAPAFVRGATLSGTITSGGAPAAGVTVAVHRGSATIAATTTDATGSYAVPALAAGAYAVTVGVNDQGDPEDLPEDPADIPPPTSDDVLPRTVPITVDRQHHDLRDDLALSRAGHVTGTVALRAGASGRVFVEDGTRHIVRVGIVRNGRYDVGGLKPGADYTFVALASSGNPATATYASASVHAVAGTLSRDLAPHSPALTLSGRVPHATAGSVQATARTAVLPRLVGSGAIAASGAYTVHGLIPGRYDVVVNSNGRLESRPRVLTLTASASHDYRRGALAGAYRVRFVSGAAPARRIQASATDPAGDRVDLDAFRLNGTARADGVHPGVYTYVPSSFRAANGYDVPAADGPWWFGAPARRFAVTGGRTTDDGTIALHVHATR